MIRIWVFLLACLAVQAHADERILDYRSEILVERGGWIEVTERIRVRAEGKRIRHGIYRDFPTRYEDRLGNDYVVDFEPVTVLRDDTIEDWHVKDLRDGERVYFGSADRSVGPGVYTYTFRYRANRMLGYFRDHDELYWNVTGFDWAFPIDHAEATVRFEFDVPPGEIRHEAYTGPPGATGRDYTSRIDSGGRVHFEANRPLSPVNGLTIVAGWPKGFVAEPTRATKFGWLLKDNLNLLAALAGLGLLLAYFVPVWRRYGKDPAPGPLVTRYAPPAGFSPASLRYIRQMYYDDKVMTAAIVNLAVKGYLRIDVEGGSDGFLGIGRQPDTWSLMRTSPAATAPPLAAGEKELHDALFAAGDSIVLEQDNHVLLGKARQAHAASLNRDYNRHYFRWNIVLNIPGVAIALLGGIVALKLGPSVLVVATVAAMAVVTVVFSVIMKSPTLRGRKALDEMLGFRDYLEIAEKDELNLRNPPEKTPQLFEAYLPFALALGVDQQWSEKFAGVLASIREPGSEGYRPAWYGGTWNGRSPGLATSGFSSALNSAVSSSVRAPGSSSGGGGGGSSGGGGGGGGGGGW